MEQASQFGEDIRFVRNVVDRAERSAGQTPPVMAWLWGSVMLAGFVLMDVNVGAAGLFWAAVLFPAGALTWWLEARRARREGTHDRRDARRGMLHFVGLGLGCMLTPLAAAGVGGLVPSPAMGRVAAHVSLLVIALCYYLAWVHWGDWVLLVTAAVLAAGYVALPFIDRYAWTFLGATVFVAFVGSATLGALRSPRVTITPSDTEPAQGAP